MGREAILIAAVCWLALGQVLSVNSAVTNSAVVKDNKSAASAPRLYRNVPVGVYASAAPYASYSFHLPQFVAAPKAAASQVAPIKQKPQNVQTYLMDSYGNKFMESPQLAPYRTAFPQQFVALQSKLPEHLAQPLVAASPNFQFKQSAPQVFFGAPFRVPALQSPAPTPLNQFPSFGQHLVYANNVQNFAPNWNSQNHGAGVPSAQQQPSNNKAVFANTQNQQQFGIKNEQKFQRLREPELIVGKPKLQNVHEPSHRPNSETKFQRIQEIPQSAHGETKFQRLQEAPQVSNSDANYQHAHEKPNVNYDKDQFQRIQESSHESHDESPKIVHVEHSYEHSHNGPKHEGGSDKAKQQAAPAKQTTITYVNNINGKQSIVKVKTQPLPLLDLTLLEPLTFKNPLVPQVQHFLPRINQATYQKLPDAVDTVNNYQKGYVVQKTMSYDSGNLQEKPQKKKQKKPTQTNKHAKKNDAPKKTSVPHHETLDDAPEIVYEINAPGHKETYKEKALSYNKETQSEPVHYSYGSKTESDPATYSYSRTSKEPVKEVHYHTNNPSPVHLNYNIKPETQHNDGEGHSAPHSEPENHEDASKESEDEPLEYNHQQYTGNYNENPKPSEKHYEPVHKEREHYHKSNQGKQDESLHADPSKYYSPQNQPNPQFFNFEPIIKEYSEDITLLNNAQIKVDPDQHVKTPSRQHEPSPNREQSYTPHEQHSPPHNKPSSGPQNHYYSTPHSESYGPAAHIQEKSKRVIIQEEAPDERHALSAQMKEEVVDQEENNEEDFEKAYKNAAIGFPAYSKEALDAAEKDIFDPESYGVPPDHVEYDIENTPFQQYQEDGDSFPKETRSNYKDARDKMKEDYYTDYSVSKPESLLDRYQNKLGYYKLYKQQKPEYYIPKHVHDDDKNQKQKFAKYSVSPSFDFSSPKESKDKTSHYSGHYKPKQALHEYDYSNGSPRDNSAFASRPYQRYKSKTNFVEPQFQYGFEPLTIPKLLDSELAAMASNLRPESEKPAMRKKVYKENWYIKKTSTSAGAPSS
ncbi:unnamed protein product [Chrysodeixis includens]|uniref:Uncharacterized protein n=1 Tax=Chrysodeixis includens TaxID=689277 RepID=A0A9P0FSD7_CHRIL|nr:unnamed protein product [Chrysodeixis includens]